MIQFVLDCSVAISWCLVDENNDYANAVLALMPDAETFVPEIFTLEIANTLLVSERRNRMTSAQTASAINLIQSLPISIDSQTNKYESFRSNVDSGKRTRISILRRSLFRVSNQIRITLSNFRRTVSKGSNTLLRSFIFIKANLKDGNNLG